MTPPEPPQHAAGPPVALLGGRLDLAAPHRHQGELGAGALLFLTMLLIAYEVSLYFRTLQFEFFESYVQLYKPSLCVSLGCLGECFLSLRRSSAPAKHPLDNLSTLQRDSSCHRSSGNAAQSGCTRYKQSQT